MGRVGGRGTQHDLGVGGELDLAHARAVIRQRDAAHFALVLGRHHHLEARLDRTVSPADLRAILREDRLCTRPARRRSVDSPPTRRRRCPRRAGTRSGRRRRVSRPPTSA